MGLKIEVDEEEVEVGNYTDQNGKGHSIKETQYNMHFKGTVVNESSNDDFDMDDVKSKITDSLKRQFTGFGQKGDKNFSWNITVDLEVADSAKNAREDDHIIAITDAPGGGKRNYGQTNEIGANRIELNKMLLEKSGMMHGGINAFDFTAAGEVGHTMGLWHTNQMGSAGVTRLAGPNALIPSVRNDKSNFMEHQNPTGTGMNVDQVQRVNEFYNNTEAARAIGSGFSGNKFQYINRGLTGYPKK